VLKVQVAEIPKEGWSVKVTDPSWFPDREVLRRDDLVANVSLSRLNERVFVSGSIEVVMLLNCDRCLEEFELPVNINFRVVYDLSGMDPALASREYECSQDEMEVDFLDEPILDLGGILSQQLILAIPLKKLCRSDCLGFCPDCGEELNKSQCCCPGGDVDSPFGVLSQLITKKN
jgi:uncharacterized protein